MPTHHFHAGSGYELRIQHLLHWGVETLTGVTGGGVIHLLKHLEPHQWPPGDTASLRFFNLTEYSAGFTALGCWLATGRPGAAVATSGAATRLLACAISDAKLHDIPAVFLVPRTPQAALNPLQDTSAHGSNMIAQLAAELGGDVFVLDRASELAATLGQARLRLARNKPVVLVLDHAALSVRHIPCPRLTPPGVLLAAPRAVQAFCQAFALAVSGRRVVLLAGELWARCPQAAELTHQLCQQLQSPVVWSLNGADAVGRDNSLGYGYLGFGGNDQARLLWQSLGAEDVVLVLGACADEYTVNMTPIAAGDTFTLTPHADDYGQQQPMLERAVAHRLHQLVGPLQHSVQSLLTALRRQAGPRPATPPAPQQLNNQLPAPPRPGHVNLATLYLRLEAWWPAGSLGFDDVCQAYKDRPYCTQRAHPNIRFNSLYRGSAMGGAFGLAVGARLAAPHRPVFLFTGDGCLRLFAGGMPETAHLGLVMFLLNNQGYAIVEQGLREILPLASPERYHSTLQPMDYCALARAANWKAALLMPDLSNLATVLAQLGHTRQSVLIEVPVDRQQILGQNPRTANL